MEKRARPTLVAFAIMILAWTESGCPAASPQPGLERFYIGTYSGAIYQSTLNISDPGFGLLVKAATSGSPSFVALTPNRQFLYAVNENGDAVVAFSVSATNGTLSLLNQMPSNGGAPAYVTVDRSGKNVMVANYNGGSVTLFPILTNGKLATATAHIQHPGASPHPHCVTLDASNHFAFVCDKGLDQIRCYLLDADAGILTSNATLITSVTNGSGPRHMAFDPEFRRAYVICETASTIIGFNFDATNGVLTSFQTVSTLPPSGFAGNTTAEIVVHPSGRFVYGSNRGHNTVVVFTINPADGTLTQIQQQKTGLTPRNFAIDPTGAFCIVAGQDSNDIRLYTINSETGLLHDTGKKLSVSQPVCILPFILNPPQPVLAVHPGTANTIELNIDNSLSLLTYEVYQAPAITPGIPWSLLMTGNTGQTNFVLSPAEVQQYFQVGVLTNY